MNLVDCPNGQGAGFEFQCNLLYTGSNPVSTSFFATIAQKVERLPCKQKVTGSIPVGGTFAIIAPIGRAFL